MRGFSLGFAPGGTNGEEGGFSGILILNHEGFVKNGPSGTQISLAAPDFIVQEDFQPD